MATRDLAETDRWLG